MPNTKSAKKRMHTSEVKRQANHAVTSRLATTRRKLMNALAGGDKAASEAIFQTYRSSLDKAVKAGAIKANNADRRKARIAARLAAL